MLTYQVLLYDIWRNIKTIKKKSNLTIEEPAKEIGISKQSIIDYESDTTFPKIDIINRR